MVPIPEPPWRYLRIMLISLWKFWRSLVQFSLGLEKCLELLSAWIQFFIKILLCVSHKEGQRMHLFQVCPNPWRCIHRKHFWSKNLFSFRHYTFECRLCWPRKWEGFVERRCPGIEKWSNLFRRLPTYFCIFAFLF